MVTLNDAREVARKLAEKISPVSVIVFGSVARSGKGVDLDVLVVTEEEDMNAEVSGCLRDYQKRFGIDYFVASIDMITSSFREGSPFLNLIQKEGRILYMKNSRKEWIELAQEDLRQAEYLFNGEFHRGACFAAQQAVEKAIKAELLKRGWELEKIHHIRRLISISSDYGLHIACDEDDVDFIDSIYRGRYPVEEGLLPLKVPGHDDANRAISIAKSIFRQVKLFPVNDGKEEG